MKITDVQAVCSRKNNAMSWDETVPGMFFFEINVKFDKTTNLLHIFGSSRGGMGCDLSNQILGPTFTLLDIPSSIKSVIDKMIDKCDGFQVNDCLFDAVEKFLAEKLSGIEFDFSDRDKERLKDPDLRRRYGYSGDDYN